MGADSLSVWWETYSHKGRRVWEQVRREFPNWSREMQTVEYRSRLDAVGERPVVIGARVYGYTDTEA